ncbi:MAG: hybrid sensor histidine kinase/response regulator, partial [Clostridiaceae bacterium]|nr:hybrid sensor histidine kinase/response regulator [Clostridiaceae bacterium]
MSKYRKNILIVMIALVIVVGLSLTSIYSYLLFHNLAELFSIVVGFTLFIIAWNSREFSEGRIDYLTFIGIAYLFISFLDLLHTLSYKGMYIFKDYDYYANQLWIAARYLESISLLVLFIYLRIKKRFRPYLIFVVYTIITSTIIASIFY